MDVELERLLNGAIPKTRQRDARTMLQVMQRITGQAPVVTGSIIGFGSYEYRYASGRQGTGPAAAFAPRKDALVIYLVDGVSAHADALARLGPHRAGVGCVYIKDLSQVDLAVLEPVIAKSYATLTAGVYTFRAREGRSR
jgi:hypothetical protein